RIDHDHAIALGLQRFDRLRPRIIELCRLADDDRPRADDQDRLDVGALGHQRPNSFPRRPPPEGARTSCTRPCSITERSSSGERLSPLRKAGLSPTGAICSLIVSALVAALIPARSWSRSRAAKNRSRLPSPVTTAIK